MQTYPATATVLFEHLFLAVLSYKEFQKIQFLNDYGLNIEETRTLLQKLVQKKIKRILHPETDDNKEEEKSEDTDAIFDSAESAKVFERAVAKLSTSNYEILGTEQNFYLQYLKTKAQISIVFLKISGLQVRDLTQN